MLHALALSSVLSVKITSDWRYWGKHIPTATVDIERVDGALRNGREPADAGEVQALLDAIESPPVENPAPQSVGVDSAWYDQNESKELPHCSGMQATATATQAYNNAFRDPAAFAAFLRTYYTAPESSQHAQLTLRVSIATTQGTIEIVSRSLKPGLLPFTITTGNDAVRTYNGAISQALERLVPPSPISRGLSFEDLEWQWADRVCSDDLRQFAFKAYLPHTLAYAKQHGIEFSGFISGMWPAAGLSAQIRIEQPRAEVGLIADASAGDDAILAMVQQKEQLLRHITSIPWVHKMLTSEHGTLGIDDAPGSESDMDLLQVAELRGAGFGTLADRLSTDLPRSSRITLYIRRGIAETDWYVLPNDDMLLVDYRKGEGTLPFDENRNARIAARAKPYDPPVVTVGVLIHPDGTMEP